SRDPDADDPLGLRALSENAYQRGASTETHLSIESARMQVRVDYCAPRPGLWVFSAGDDARPLVRLAR
ncbi:MAG: hypothetical protein ACRD2D_13290, partial [Terriglobales bacterium]